MTGNGLERVERRGGYTEVTLRREFDHDVRAVWAALTDSARLAQWLAPGTIELRDGGAAKLNFVDSGIVIDSKVTALDPPYLLEYSWSGPGEPSRPLRWHLVGAPAKTTLSLTVSTPAGEDVARACAGFEAHLEMLAAALEGVPIKFPFERFKQTREAYKQVLG
jgi:uncharacterized protein YndB with AHSA1/START domain